MNLPEPPAVDHGNYSWSLVHTRDELEAYGKSCYYQAIMDAMNEARTFGRTGETVALCIKELAKDTK